MKQMRFQKALSRTGRSAAWLAVSAVVVQVMEAFTNFDKKQLAAVGAAVNLFVIFFANTVEESTDRHFLETPTPPHRPGDGEAYEPDAVGNA